MDIFRASWVTKGLCLEVHVCGVFFSCIYNLEIFLSNNLLIPVKLLGYQIVFLFPALYMTIIKLFDVTCMS